MKSKKISSTSPKMESARTSEIEELKTELNKAKAECKRLSEDLEETKANLHQSRVKEYMASWDYKVMKALYNIKCEDSNEDSEFEKNEEVARPVIHCHQGSFMAININDELFVHDGTVQIDFLDQKGNFKYLN